MQSEELKQMIDAYFDGELDKSKEPVLFSVLSTDEECREYFRKLNVLKNSLDETTAAFPDNLEERILYSVGEINQKRKNKFGIRNVWLAASFAMVVILIAASVFFYSVSTGYKTELKEVNQKVSEQGKVIELLYNSMPAVNINSSFHNEIVVKAKL